MNRFVVVIHDPTRGIDYLAIGPFDSRDAAQAEARRWRTSGSDVRAMVRNLWDGDDLRRVMNEAVPDATP